MFRFTIPLKTQDFFFRRGTCGSEIILNLRNDAFFESSAVGDAVIRNSPGIGKSPVGSII